MHILAVGVNHRTAPVKIREKLTFDSWSLDEALTLLRGTKSIFEDVIVSTCNRTEIYVVSDQLHTGRYYTKRFFADWFGISMNDLMPFLFIKEDNEAVRHLFHVTCGLDSMILGETQILGQVRDSFLAAQKTGTTGTLFNELFKEAVTVAKRAQSESQINDHPVSVSYAAVELAKKTFGPLKDKSILVIGAGTMSELALKHLTGGGASRVTIINRTMEKAERMAERFSGRALPFDMLDQAVEKADMIISSTSAPGYILSLENVSGTVIRRKGRPLFLVDIAVPRDIDPAVHSLENVSLYDIDDLETIVAANFEERKKAASLIEPMIDEQILKFCDWLQTLGVVPVITALRKKALVIHAETMKSIERKLPEMSDRERKVISKHMKSIINQLLRDPINKVKELAGDKEGKEAVELFIDIFNISEEVRAEQPEKRAAVFGADKEKRTPPATDNSRYGTVQGAPN
ncbi:glutamyl-tRNA reductase [Sporolactobacillus sp. THM7-4]|nr:glutamyl-tRNA reductase [Sporolactobacillus sp. THM7-4]